MFTFISWSHWPHYTAFVTTAKILQGFQSIFRNIVQIEVKSYFQKAGRGPEGRILSIQPDETLSRPISKHMNRMANDGEENDLGYPEIVLALKYRKNTCWTCLMWSSILLEICIVQQQCSANFTFKIERRAKMFPSSSQKDFVVKWFEKMSK